MQLSILFSHPRIYTLPRLPVNARLPMLNNIDLMDCGARHLICVMDFKRNLTASTVLSWNQIKRPLSFGSSVEISLCPRTLIALRGIANA